MSWNIQGGKNLPAVCDVISEFNPDIIALQEVKQEAGSSNSVDMIADNLGEYSAHFYPAFRTDRHEMAYTLGNGILSRLPVTSNQLVWLSTIDEYEGSSTTEPRTAGIAEIRTPQGTLHAVSAHVAYSNEFGQSDMRDEQIGRLLAVTRNLRPVILGVDLNSQLGSVAYDSMQSQFANADGENIQPTWTNNRSDLTQAEYRIDYIFADTSVKPDEFQIINTDASDHRPLILDFHLAS